MRIVKKFENFDVELSDYYLGTKPDKLYVDFDSTHDPFQTADGRIVGNTHNSFSSFREVSKRITPTDEMINSVVDIFSEVLGDLIDHHKYYPDFRQLYFYTWHGRTTMSYSEREKTNMMKIIVDFYNNDWIFVALIDSNDIASKEKHSICKGLDGLREYLIDKKDQIV
jgi:hypothetical protein